MSKKNINNKRKQSNKSKLEVTKNKNRIFLGVLISITLLALFLFGILKITSSSHNDIMTKFEEVYESDDEQIIFYNDSSTTYVDENSLENDYLIQIKKDFKIDYLDVDISKMNNKNIDDINNKLGISGKTPSIIVVKDKKIIAVNEGFIESHNLISFLVKANVLKEGDKYSKVDNLKFIDYDRYNEIIKEKKDSIVVVGKAACKYCESVKPILNNISKAYKVDINYLDLSDMKKEDAQDFFEKIPEQGYKEEKLENEGVFSTPTLFIIKKGKIDNYMQNARSLDEYVEYLKDNKMIK